MTKHNTIFNLLQNFISPEDLAEILQEYGFEDVARKCTVDTLLHYLVGAAVFKWESMRDAADRAPSEGLARVNYSTLSKRLKALDFHIIKQILHRIIGRLNRAARRSLRLPKGLLAIDSTTITVGKTRWPWAVYHGERAGIKLHVSYAIETGMPLQVIETTGLKNDGPIGVHLEDGRFILVGDRAYFSIDKVDRYVRTKQDFVIRLKENIQLHRKKSLKGTRTKDSNIVADFTCLVGSKQKQTEKRHRIVEFTDEDGAIIRVITSLRHVTAEEIAHMYKERWAIESFFRWIKQNLHVPTLYGTTPNAVYSQCFAALIAYVLLKFLHTTCLRTPTLQVLSFVGFKRQLLCEELPIEWKLRIREIQAFYGL